MIELQILCAFIILMWADLSMELRRIRKILEKEFKEGKECK